MCTSCVLCTHTVHLKKGHCCCMLFVFLLFLPFSPLALASFAVCLALDVRWTPTHPNTIPLLAHPLPFVCCPVVTQLTFAFPSFSLNNPFFHSSPKSPSPGLRLDRLFISSRLLHCRLQGKVQPTIQPLITFSRQPRTCTLLSLCSFSYSFFSHTPTYTHPPTYTHIPYHTYHTSTITHLTNSKDNRHNDTRNDDPSGLQDAEPADTPSTQQPQPPSSPPPQS